MGATAAAVIVFFLVGLGPSFLFLSAGLGEDETATESAVGDMLGLIGFALVSGAVAAAVTWAVARGRPGGLRTGAVTALVLLAGAWGVVTGFLGSVSISMARHPTWDDA